MPLNDVYRIVSYTALADQLAINVFHYAVTAVVGTGADQQAVATAFDNLYNGVLAPAVNNHATYRGSTAQLVSGAKPYPLPSAETGNARGCDGTGDPLPTQTCGITTWRTKYAGRKYRGRTYWPFPSETDNAADGLPNAAYITKLADIAAVISIPFAAGGGGNTITLSMVVWHQASKTFDYITGYVNRSRWGTQHRRGSYGRQNVSPF